MSRRFPWGPWPKNLGIFSWNPLRSTLWREGWRSFRKCSAFAFEFWHTRLGSSRRLWTSQPEPQRLQLSRGRVWQDCIPSNCKPVDIVPSWPTSRWIIMLPGCRSSRGGGWKTLCRSPWVHRFGRCLLWFEGWSWRCWMWLSVCVPWWSQGVALLVPATTLQAVRRKSQIYSLFYVVLVWINCL